MATASEIRTWARENGMDIKPTGVVPSRIVQMYEEAQASWGPARAGAACACGCGLEANRVYRPGHDAKHVSWQLAQLKAGTYDGSRGFLDAVMALRGELPTIALRNKFVRAVTRAVHQEDAKSTNSRWCPISAADYVPLIADRVRNS